MRKNSILYLGSSGFPFGTANIQRKIQLSKTIISCGYNVIIINRRGSHSKAITEREKIKTHGFFDDIEYIYSSILPFKSKYFITRNFFKLIGLMLELPIIVFYILFKKVKYFFVNAMNLKTMKYYYFISKLFGVELIYDYLEMSDSVGRREIEQVNYTQKKVSFDQNFYKYTDKIIVISKFLFSHIKRYTDIKPVVLVPPIIDFSLFDLINPKKITFQYFLFCGSASYIDIIRFIVTSYNKSISIDKNIKLILIINGSDGQKKRVKELIDKNVDNKMIILTSNMPYNELISYYKSASALLIPLTNNLQDKARFPFKISEYSASRRPIITTDSGPIKDFFIDNVNAFIAKTGSINDFTNKMDLVIKESDLADKVGLEGYQLGLKVFDYRAYIDVFKRFL